MDHDQNFKNLIIDYPFDALRLFAASEAPRYHQGVVITPIRQQQLQQQLGGRYRELDVPLLVEWQAEGATTNKAQREALLFVLEEESNQYRFSIHRLAHYCLDLAKMFNTTRVVPVVIFLGKQSPDTQLVLAGDDGDYLNFRYLYTALGQLPWQQYQHSDNLVACLNLPNMQHAPEQRIDVHAKALQGLIRLEQDVNQQAKYLDFIDIYSKLSDNEQQSYALKYPEEVKLMSNFAQRHEQKGVQKGEAVMLLRLIETKFGKPNADIRQRVQEADSQHLLQWSERILTAHNIDELWH